MPKFIGVSPFRTKYLKRFSVMCDNGQMGYAYPFMMNYTILKSYGLQPCSV